MKRKLMIFVFFFISFTGVSLYSQNEIITSNTIDFSEFEKKLKLIDEKMAYLKNNSIESNDIITLYKEADSLYQGLKNGGENRDSDQAQKFLSYKLSVLEEKSTERISFARSMDIIYILMTGMGLAIVIIMSIYSGYMYSRRK